MQFNSKKTLLLLLGTTSVVFSRAMFLFFNDSEGPNLLVVIGIAAAVYFLSLAVYLFYSSATDLKRLWVAILIQMLLVTGLYFFLR
jgi:hypothetical protein